MDVLTMICADCVVINWIKLKKAEYKHTFCLFGSD